MYSFNNDYSEGAAPQILDALVRGILLGVDDQVDVARRYGRELLPALERLASRGAEDGNDGAVRVLAPHRREERLKGERVVRVVD